jgi:hypothetical protein
LAFFKEKICMANYIKTIRIELEAGKSSYFFPNDSVLSGSNVEILKISIRVPATGAKASNGQLLPSAEVYNAAHLILKTGSTAVIDYIPVSYFYDDKECCGDCKFSLKNWNIQNSSLNFGTAPADNTTMEFIVCYSTGEVC